MLATLCSFGTPSVPRVFFFFFSGEPYFSFLFWCFFPREFFGSSVFVSCFECFAVRFLVFSRVFIFGFSFFWFLVLCSVFCF